jgi:hypothetical protein
MEKDWTNTWIKWTLQKLYKLPFIPLKLHEDYKCEMAFDDTDMVLIK